MSMSGVRRSYHHGDLREAAMQAALELVVERGDASFTMRDLAGRVGVTHSALYRHFPDRSALFQKLATDGFEIFAASERAALAEAAPNPIERVVALGRNHISFATGRPALYRVMFGSRVGEHRLDAPAVQAAARPTLKIVADVAAGLGLREGRDPLEVAIMLWSAVHGLSILALDGQLQILGDPSLERLQALAESSVRAIAREVGRHAD